MSNESKHRLSIGMLAGIVVAALAILYITGYVYMRRERVLIYDSIISQNWDGKWVSGLDVGANPYSPDDTTPMQEQLGPPAAKIFYPLCKLEGQLRRALGQEPE